MRFEVVFLAAAAVVFGHKEVGEPPEGKKWEEWHMNEEHQQDFNATEFFTLHDSGNKGFWNALDILNIFGLSRDEVIGDGSGMGEHDHEEKISAETKESVLTKVMRLLDANKNGEVSKDEWLLFSEHGGSLPDFGIGPGHHMDFEAEYEKHHWNEYHRDQDPDVLVKHKEDIEHEILHHEHEIEETHDSNPDVRNVALNFASPVKVENVPAKYLKK